ncbi:MAG: chloride channel protein [Muribaculaceae bacterium]|jgi:CIC family chloride channel protein|uniref:chloride channel protein n=1 Tax=Sangeribacter muris TaxID=2880703 RepID=UPI000F49CF35|nr:chloride channel protein [Sangeribacter muris]MBJ2192286.1 chloride channel protein [Muribaculaceae bacterium]ROS84074.1 chloride channel protein [Muribaculaceae bacterium Isolate-036 (Harlan)]ROT21989.1 chloride channel protein [Muribaculaceae bacterium Isolate-114 (HZI)]ROT23916.1 chloride channel protein [Muribaculaceae bacterium Isolate-113 (HZI)]RXE69484.1 chloride channel protein [Muribaculaceae bacterium Isolate-001 (NCI)]
MAYKERHNRFTDLWMKLVIWREHHIREKSFLLILALFVGVCCGFAAQLLKYMIHMIAGLLTAHMNTTTANWLYLVYPVVGILIVTILLRYVVKENISHGVTKVLYAISRRKSRLKKRNMYASLLASSITIGFGGSVGAEGPIVFTGAAIGSNVGQAFRMSPRILMILVGCGAAAGIAGIFRAPIAGMLFTLEVLMIDLSGMTVMPLLLSSVAGAVVAYVLEGYNAEFFFVQSESFVTNRIPFTILLGVVCGLMSYYFTKVMFMMESMFSKLRHTGLKILVGGVIMAGLIFLFPPLYGEGYEAINNLLLGDVSNIVDGTFFYVDRDNVWFLILFIGAIALTKAFATSATNGAGGVGGTFAPSLFVGALTGFLFAYIVNNLDLGFQLSQKNFALMGMAGVMSGVMHAPLMAIFLTAEMTGGYDLFLPLLIVSALAYITIRIFTPYSIYTMRLAKAGDLVTHQKDKAVLTLLKVDNLIETDFKIVHPEMNLKEMVDTISVSNRNLFPVTDSEGNLKGVVLLDEIRNIMFRADLYKKMHVSRFMSAVPEVIEITYPMDKVMEIFDRTNAWNLPVVDNGRYVGFVSKSKIFNSYRRVLRHFTED